MGVLVRERPGSMLVRCALISLLLAGAATPAPLENQVSGAAVDAEKTEVPPSEPEVEPKKENAVVEPEKQVAPVEAKKQEEETQREVEEEREENGRPVVTDPVTNEDREKIIDEILSTVNALENSIIDGPADADANEEMETVRDVGEAGPVVAQNENTEPQPVGIVAEIVPEPVEVVAEINPEPVEVVAEIEPQPEEVVAEIVPEPVEVVVEIESEPEEVVAEIDSSLVEEPVVTEIETKGPAPQLIPVDTLEDPAQEILPAEEIIPTEEKETSPPNYSDYEEPASQVDEISGIDYSIPEYSSTPEDEIIVGVAKEPMPLPPRAGEPSRPIEENPFVYSAEPDNFSGPENPEPPIAEFSPIPEAPIVAIEGNADESSDVVDPTENEVEPTSDKKGPSIIIFTIRSPISPPN